MAGHARLKFVITECTKSQIRLTRPNFTQHMMVCVSNFNFKIEMALSAFRNLEHFEHANLCGQTHK